MNAVQYVIMGVFFHLSEYACLDRGVILQFCIDNDHQLATVFLTCHYVIIMHVQTIT